MPDKTIKVPQRLTRESIIRAAADGETITMSISSDVPYLRESWYDEDSYYEVLDHSPGGVDEERLKSGLPILYNHDRNALIGRGVSFENDGHKITVTARFSDSLLAKEKFADVKSGVLVDTSVGYEILGDGICIGAKNELPIYKFKFKIYEGSLVSIPADSTVGVGRHRGHKPEGEPREILIRSKEGIDTPPSQSKTNPQSPSPMAELITPPAEPKPAIDPAKERAEAIKEFKARCKKIDDFVAALKNEAWKKKAQVIANKHKELEADFEAFRSEANDQFTTETVIDEPQRSDGRIQVIGERHNHTNGQLALSAGAQFVRSKEFQERGPQIGRRRSITIDTDMSVMGVRGKVALAQRAGFNSSDLTAINVAPVQQIVALGVQRLTIMDLIAPGTTSAAAIPYPVENTLGTLDGAALTAGRPMAGTVGERGVKPTWEPDITVETANVKKIAVITKVPDEFLADFPGFQSYIDNRLPVMVDLKAEQQMLYGDGIGNNIKGITTFAGIQTRAYATSWADTFKKAVTDIEVGSFFMPDGIAIHPYDWETASLEKDVNGQYLAGGPVLMQYGTGVYVRVFHYWGLPVVVTTAVTVGQPVVGCFGLGAQYFLREGMRIETTNSNEDDFKRNLIALRAEERLALAVYRPPCFLEVTGGPART